MTKNSSGSVERVTRRVLAIHRAYRNATENEPAVSERRKKKDSQAVALINLIFNRLTNSERGDAVMAVAMAIGFIKK